MIVFLGSWPWDFLVVHGVIACAFDHRTRMLPFAYSATRMAPAGVRAIGSALLDSGFDRTRIVLQQWNRGFRPSQMRLDGCIPDIFMVSSMQIHSAACEALIRDACRIDPVHRPLIIAGGPKAIYEPWDFFSADPLDPWGADVAVTGEEYVLLRLLEVLLSVRAKGESLRTTFVRARNGGILYLVISTSCHTRCSVTGCLSRPAPEPRSRPTLFRPAGFAGTVRLARSC